MNFVHQFGDQTRLYHDARSTNHQEFLLQFLVVSADLDLQFINNFIYIALSNFWL
jgi:hypothetical protein